MVGQSVLLHAAVGDEIRLYNFGGDIYEDDTTPDEEFLHFIGVLLYASDRSWKYKLSYVLFSNQFMGLLTRPHERLRDIHCVIIVSPLIHVTLQEIYDIKQVKLASDW